MLKKAFNKTIKSNTLFKNIGEVQLTQSENFGVSCSIDELIALKTQAEKLKFPLKRKSRSHLMGAKQSTLRGRGLDFDEVRAYQAGDEIRSIDWRVTARTGSAHTKVYKEEKEKPVYVLLDLRSPMFFGSSHYFKSVSACHLATLLAWASLKNGDRFGALVFSEHAHQEQKPKAGNKAALNFIHTASVFCENLLPEKNKNEAIMKEKVETLNSALNKLRQVVRPGSLIYMISDFHDFDDESKKCISMLARHNDLFAIHITDPLEQALPEAKRLLFTNSAAKENAITEIHGEQQKVRQAYKNYFSTKNKKIENEMIMTGVPSIYISTHAEVFEQLQGMRISGNK